MVKYHHDKQTVRQNEMNQTGGTNHEKDHRFAAGLHDAQRPVSYTHRRVLAGVVGIFVVFHLVLLSVLRIRRMISLVCSIVPDVQNFR